MTNRKIIKALVLVAAAFGASCSSPRQQTEVKGRLKWTHQAQFAGFYTADQKGFYRDAGLQVKINPGGSDFPAVQMVVGGGEQFGGTGADQILLARAKGVP